MMDGVPGATPRAGWAQGLRLVGPDEPQTRCKLCFQGVRADLGELFEYVVDPASEVYCAHFFCLLFSAGLEQTGQDDEGIQGFLLPDILREWRRGQRLKCVHCDRKYATLGCRDKTCRKTFHLPCARDHGDGLQFCDDFASFCREHRPRQQGQFPAEGSEEAVCGVCLEIMNQPANCLWGPCCQGWYHQDCIQRLANTAGYFFKCPLCNNKDAFVREMQLFGIFVPEQDAAWEMEEDAFESLLERHAPCDAPNCACPDGRDHDEDDTPWETILCRCCGAKAIHLECAQKVPLPVGSSERHTWTCSDCRAVLRARPPSYTNHYRRVRNESHVASNQLSGLLTRVRFQVSGSLSSPQLSVRHANLELSINNVPESSESEPGILSSSNGSVHPRDEDPVISLSPPKKIQMLKPVVLTRKSPQKRSKKARPAGRSRKITQTSDKEKSVRQTSILQFCVSSK
ncbi:hypothetical protein TCAL_01625 [Tigriopus californicus]|uniref:PHD-type domain-containing protein n=1 Tax=Tigriopus californicus TaxID=6832 RepID=A0A553PAE5_TIGCA|nr:PHD finger protein 7-like [Tigriopus californicus]TRY74649.1 hypothetical protein TCAL_01625 [Tigriopus californicus]|eukprot:TCALIF_01625-PA protein Name:"Similar to G2e3 G2/M phase-specific E3 ubiquitin-protein ligase (Mus musculus)" AED:0.03 eAED:0.03 QI:498/1/1/1/0.5/0.33/3/232/456